MKAERHGSQRFVFSYLNSVIVALYVAPTSRDSVQCLVKENKRNKRQKKIREEEIKLEISKLLQTLNNREFTISR